ncbi:DUF3618 domain-containing protein [Pseudarthrobacter enclensis]|uniref:DUF3618 domain-containing protein n=1 Tax=Pseudarthrobacter enclensis TaxID=993070 RepID=UPI0036D0B226
MSENPDAIRADIEATRARLGTNVDAVADKVTPSNIVHRQTDKLQEKVRETVTGVKEKVMGAADHTTTRVHNAAGTGTGHAGNPLAAGLIAFGAGMLISSLIPASDKEREAADQLKTAAQPLATQVTDAAKTVVEDLKEPAQQAMDNVKATATDAAEHVKTEGQHAATDVKDRATDAKDTIQNT